MFKTLEVTSYTYIQCLGEREELKLNSTFVVLAALEVVLRRECYRKMVNFLIIRLNHLMNVKPGTNIQNIDIMLTST
jgi:hypothetical protein